MTYLVLIWNPYLLYINHNIEALVKTKYAMWYEEPDLLVEFNMNLND